MRSPVEPVQHQLEAYNARARHYADNRFTLPGLHAAILNRIVAGNVVVDHERITGLQDGAVEAVAVYRVEGERIRAVWFY